MGLSTQSTGNPAHVQASYAS